MCLAKLVELNHRDIVINASVLAIAARLSYWKPVGYFSVLIKCFSYETTDISTAINGVGELLHKLYLEIPLPQQLDNFVTPLLNALTYGRPSKEICDTLKKQIAQRFHLLQPQSDRIISIIDAYDKSKLIV